jgi:IS6 family transposase
MMAVQWSLHSVRTDQIPEKVVLQECVRWYLPYSLSHRDLEEMMNERGLSLDHTTIYRWVQAYAPG